ncbi:unnamed protein product [Arctogadus glacialis]
MEVCLIDPSWTKGPTAPHAIPSWRVLGASSTNQGPAPGRKCAAVRWSALEVPPLILFPEVCALATSVFSA